MVKEYEVRSAISDAFFKYGWSFAGDLELELDEILRHKTLFSSPYPSEDRLKSIIDRAKSGKKHKK